jgi:putative salt-induced outer membrane protein
MKLQFPLLAALLLSLTMHAAQAKIPSAEDGELKRWEGGVELGYTDTTGNTEDTSLKTAADLTFRTGQWRNISHFDTIYNESEGDSTAEKYYATNRLAWLFTRRDYIWQSLSYEDDEFNGFEYTFSAALGYGRNLLDYETMDWLLEFGPGYRFTETEDTKDEFGVITAEGEEEDEVIFRIYSQYQWRFTETSMFDQTLSSEIGEDNTISRSISALSVQVIGSLIMKLSYEVKNSSEVPDDKENTDTITAVTLLYKF